MTGYCTTTISYLLVITALSWRVDVTAFVPTITKPLKFGSAVRKTSFLSMSNNAVNDEVEALKAKAAKLREEANVASQALGKEISAKPITTSSFASSKKLSQADITSALATINFEQNTAEEQSKELDDLVKKRSLSLWKASSGSLRTFPVSLEYMSSRSGGLLTGETLGVTADGSNISLDDIKDATIAVTLGASVLAIAALKFLPENVGATLCYFIALVPIGFIAIGSTAPGLITGGLSKLKGTSDTAETKTRRICVHEAGHFLCGYLCGLPLKSYTIDEATGFPSVEFHPSSVSTTSAELTKEEIAALSVVALSGSVAEVLTFGQACGGEGDLMELDRLLRRSEEFIGAQKQQDLTRWGALTAYNLIKSNMSKYEKLIESFELKKSVAECIASIEACD